MHTTSITIEVTEVEENSLGGNVLKQTTTAPDSSSIFPITKFPTSFQDLSISDAEKAFEIAYRMRMELLYKCLVAPPSLLYESNEGGVKFLLAETIGKHITPYFGELKWEWEFPKN